MKSELIKMGMDELKNIVFFMLWVNSGPHSNTVGGDNAP